jgi:secondary thiamine-phosphate synthase enzyme
MPVITRYIELDTSGNGDLVEITSQVEDCVRSSGMDSGIAVVFSPSATSGITTLEFEPGCIKDLQRVFDELIPAQRDYFHNARWGDGNGHSHARAALLKPSLTVPFVAGKLTLGTWQSIILADFDNRPRSRRLVVQLLGD